MNGVDVAMGMEGVEFDHVKGKEIGILTGGPAFGIN
jgi:hypothetical protein